MKERNLFEARETVNGPRKCRTAERRPISRDEAPPDEADDLLVPLKATGVISNPLSGKSGVQWKVEAR